MKLKDVYVGGSMDDSAGKPVATEENQVFWEFSGSEYEDEVPGKPVAYKNSAASSISENSGNPEADRRK